MPSGNTATALNHNYRTEYSKTNPNLTPNRPQIDLESTKKV